jgi:hypothetical protein
VAGLAAVVLSCSSGGLTVPSFTFEDGLENWQPRGVDLDDPPVTWTIEWTGEEAYEGEHSVRLSLNNLNGQAKIWIEREFRLDPNRTYRVDVSYALGTSDAVGTDPWTLIAGVHHEPPSAASELTYRGDTPKGSASPAVEWVARSHQVTLASGTAGSLYVAVGVWGRGVESRVYYLDDLRVVISGA